MNIRLDRRIPAPSLSRIIEKYCQVITILSQAMGYGLMHGGNTSLTKAGVFIMPRGIQKT